MRQRNRTLTILAALLGAALVGVGGGAALYATVAASPSTKTIVRQVTVAGAQTAAATSQLTVGQIYQRTNKGVVDIVVSSQSSDQFGGSQQAEGSGFVYDTQGHVITNQHVVSGAT